MGEAKRKRNAKGRKYTCLTCQRVGPWKRLLINTAIVAENGYLCEPCATMKLLAGATLHWAGALCPTCRPTMCKWGPDGPVKVEPENG